MKLRRQAPAKAAIVALTGVLFVAFYAIIRSDPRIKAGEGAPTQPPVDYGRFFAPGAATAATEPAPPIHVRTRAS